ncbi:MAG: hypothetical protein K8T25_00765 [Planctomycetia bacterium]|nr:hypothetical protein [Planctomycetia bacterium]
MVWRLHFQLMRCSGVIAAVVLLAHGAIALAEATPAQRKAIESAATALADADRALAARKLDEAWRRFTAARELAESAAVATLPPDAAAQRLLSPLALKLSELRGRLVLEGFEPPPLSDGLKKFATNPPPAALPAPQTKPAPLPKPSPKPAPPAAGTVSFRTQIAPLLAASCVRCHAGAKPKGDFSAENFAALKRGIGGSAVIDPGNGRESRLVEIIASGEMPKGKQKLTAAQLALISRWIDQGARFDGTSEDQPLAAIVGGMNPTTPNEPASATPPASNIPPPGTSISFSTHVAPVLAANCISCHGGRQAQNRLSMDSFTQLMRGGRGGKPIKAGDAVASLLIQKIKGTAKDGQRMPQDAPPLTPEVIAAIESWVKAGAKFDGPDPARPMAEVAALGAARGASPEVLSRQRADLATRNWRLAIPDDQAKQVSNDNFLLLGNVSDKRLADAAELAQRQATAIRTALGIPPAEPLVRGRMTLYLFAHRYDYSEFALMVERRGQLPQQQVGHWNYTLVDAYALLVPPAENTPADDEPYGLAPLMTQQIAATVLAARTTAPRWFAEGVGRALAASAAPADPRVKAWDARLPGLIAEKPKVEEFLAGKLPPEGADVLSYGFARHLMAGGRNFRTLMASLMKGQAFDATIARVYGKPTPELAAAWLAMKKN